MDLFEAAAAQEAKREAMARSTANAKVPWIEYALQRVRECCLRPAFTSDDVMDLIEADPLAPKTHDLRALGGVMKNAARLGWCQKTDRVAPSRRRKLHASPRAIWKGLLK